MKKFGLIFFLYSSIMFSQSLFLEENFNYNIGDLDGQGSWIFLGTDNANNLDVISGNLDYTNYPSGSIYNSVQAISGSSRDECVREFHSSNITSGTLYFSSLVKVNSNGSDGDNDGYFMCLMAESGTTNSSRVSVVDAGSGNIQFGIQRNTGGTRTLTTSSYSNSGTPTFLLVVKHDFTTGTTSLFVNPSLSGIEPSSADASNSTGNTIANLRRIQIRQGGDASDCDVQIDGLRVADSWSQAPLPVELSSFSASINNNGVRLNWRTETEVNNFGFEVLRAVYPAVGGAQNDGWSLLGFVDGHGNSNSPKEYSFIDDEIISGKYAYRLKQIDNDGTFEYSDVIEVNAGNIPDGFVLEQNFPNPFNPATKIKFAVNAANPTTLKVYDILGSEIAQLFYETTEAGKIYEIEFDASGLSSGVYYYRLSTPQKSLVRKMLLLQ